MKKKVKLLIGLTMIVLLIATMSFATTENVDNTVTTAETETATDSAEPTEDSLFIDSEEEPAVVDDEEGEDAIDDSYTYVDDDEEFLDEDFVEDENEDSEYEENDIFLCQDEVTLDKTIDGNVYIMAKKVTINSKEIAGNVFILAEDVYINSQIDVAAYIAAKNIELKESTMYDAYFAGESVIIDEESLIYRDARITAESVTINGTVDRYLYSMAQKTTINGVVDGKLYYSGELNEGDNASIIAKEEISEPAVEVSKKAVVGSVISTIITKIVTAAVIILLIITFIKSSLVIKTKNENGQTTYYNKKSNIKDIPMALLKGLAALIAIPVISIICMITVVGAPVGLLILALYIITLFIITPIACFEFAKMLNFETNTENKLKLFVGVCAVLIYVIVTIVKLIPVLGGIIALLVVLYGLGKIVDFIFGSKCCNKNKKSNSESNNNTETKIEETVTENKEDTNNSN